MSADDAIANEQRYMLQTYQRPDLLIAARVSICSIPRGAATLIAWRGSP